MTQDIRGNPIMPADACIFASLAGRFLPTLRLGVVLQVNPTNVLVETEDATQHWVFPTRIMVFTE